MAKEMYKCLSKLENCWDAMSHNEMAYFFMRGCEGFIEGRHTPPIYKNNEKCRQMWREGHAYMSNAISEDEEIVTWLFCRAFLIGSPKGKYDDRLSTNYGYEARVHYETNWGDKSQKQKGTEDMVDKTILYRVKDRDIYGKIVGTDSLRRIILEIAGEPGKYMPFEKNDIEEVMPYTITLYGDRGQFTAIATEGEFKLEDVLLLSSEDGPFLVQVKKLNTKERETDFDIKDCFLKVLFSKSSDTRTPPADLAS